MSARARRPGGAAPLLADAAACLALLALVLALALPRYRAGLDLGDEGRLALGALRVLGGELPQRDFESPQPPLPYLTCALAFGGLGVSLASLRTFGLLLHAAITLGVYGLARTFAGRAASLGAGLLAAAVGMPFFLFVPFGAWQAIALGLVALAALIRSTGAARSPWTFGAGVATALASLARQDQGACLVLTALAHAFLQRLPGSAPGPTPLRRIATFAGGFAAVLLPVAAAWLAAGAFAAAFRQLVLFPLTTYARTSSLPLPLLAAGQSAGERALVLLFYLPPLVQAASVLLLALRFARRRFEARDGRIALVLAWSLFSSLQVLVRSDVHHLLITLPPAFMLLAAWSDAALARAAEAAARRIGRGGALVRALPAAAAGALLLSVLLVAGSRCSGRATRDSFVHRPPLELASLLPTLAEPGVELALPRAGVRLAPEDALFLAELVRFVREHARADQAILCLPYQPMLYFLAERRNPTRWNYLWPGDQTEADHRRLVAEARADPPAVVLLTEVEELAESAPEVTAYVEREYRRVGFMGPIALYLPRP